MNPRILVAENNLGVRNIMQVAFNNAAYDFMLATDGQEAVDAAAFHSPQLIFIDPLLPGLGGIEAARRIRLDPRMRSVPIVAITTALSPEIRKECLESGLDGFLARPFSIRELQAVTRKSLRRRFQWSGRGGGRRPTRTDQPGTSGKQPFRQPATPPRGERAAPAGPRGKTPGTKRCASCGSRDTCRSHRRNRWERSLSLVAIYPFRCNVCDRRFFMAGR